jgi:hypothetical protein
MPRGSRTRGDTRQAARASMSLNEQEVDAFLYMVARLEAFQARGALVPPKHDAAFKNVVAKFISMRGSITAAQASKRAMDSEAAQ